MLLWIDALCINQSDHREKNHQVGQMKSVYQNADRVLIWLGPGSKDTDDLMVSCPASISGQLNTNVSLSSLPGYDDHVDKTYYYGIQHTLVDAKALWELELWKLGKRFAAGNEKRSSTFNRVSIIQEVASARAAVVLCGSKSVSSGVFSVMPHLMDVITDSHSTAVLEIMPGPLRKRSWWDKDRRLLTLVAKFNRSKATLEHDRIYALLGIASDAPNLPIDYACPFQQVVDQTVSVLMTGDVSPSLFLKKRADFTFSEVFHGISDTASFATRVWELALKYSEDKFLKCLIDTPILSNTVKRKLKKHYYSLPYKWAVFFLYDDCSTARVTDIRHHIFKRALREHHYFVCHKVCETYGFVPKPWDLKEFLPSISDSAFEDIVKRIRADDPAELYWILEHVVRSAHRQQINVLLDHGFDKARILDDNLVYMAIDCAPNDKGLRVLLERRKIAGIDGPSATSLMWRALFTHRRHIDENTFKGIISGRMAILNLLIDYGADIEARPYGVTPVFAAVVFGLPGVAQLRAERGADLNSRHEVSSISLGPVTPMHYAERQNFPNCVATLILSGADELAEDLEGRTPWQHNKGNASGQKQRDVGEFLYLMHHTVYWKHKHLYAEFVGGRQNWKLDDPDGPL